jgi:hypothetical protein
VRRASSLVGRSLGKAVVVDSLTIRSPGKAPVVNSLRVVQAGPPHPAEHNQTAADSNDSQRPDQPGCRYLVEHNQVAAERVYGPRVAQAWLAGLGHLHQVAQSPAVGRWALGYASNRSRGWPSRTRHHHLAGRRALNHYRPGWPSGGNSPGAAGQRRSAPSAPAPTPASACGPNLSAWPDRRLHH